MDTRILIDMDNTIGDLLTPWCEMLNERHGTSVLPDDIREWDMRVAFPSLSGNQIYAPLKEPELWDRMRPFPLAQHYVQRLMDEGYCVVILTSANRYSASIKLTHFLFKHFQFLSDRDVIIARQKDLIDGDVIVDDAPHNLKRDRKLKILMSAGHNAGFDEKSVGAVRATNWEQIYKIIKDRSDLT